MRAKLGKLSINLWINRAIVIFICVLLCALFLFLNYYNSNYDSEIQSYHVGTYWTAQTLVAEYNCSIYKPRVQYRAEVQNAKDSVNPVFIKDIYAENNAVRKIKDISMHMSVNNDTILLQFSSVDNIYRFFGQNERIRAKEIHKVTTDLLPFLRNVYSGGYINRSVDNFGLSTVFTIYVLPNTEYYVNKVSIYDEHRFNTDAKQYIYSLFNEDTAPLIFDIAGAIVQPNLVYSDEQTNRSEESVERNVRKTVGIIHRGDVIVRHGERLDNENILKIKSYFNADKEQSNNNITFIKILGNLGHSAIWCTILFLYLAIARKRLWNSLNHLIMLSVPLVLTAFLGWLTFKLQLINQNIPTEYLVTIPAFSMFIAIMYDSRTAFRVTICMSLILAGVRGYDYFLGMSMFFTGMIAAYSVKDIQDRGQLFASIIFIFLGFVVSIFVSGLERGYAFSTIMPQLFLALVNAIMAPVITFLLILVINKRSKTQINNLKLREYIDKEHPLITELKEKAPGTYEHSKEISQIAAVCAKAIDANVLLVKVGAMFHDIGKIEHPNIYTENKDFYKDLVDPYLQLTPLQAATLIKQHIADGVLKAKQAKLPIRVVDFIEQHHGTYIAGHFYYLAQKDAEKIKGSVTVVNKNSFRYSGPKPQSKEACILMLSDIAQAISKSATTIEDFEKWLIIAIDERIKDRQFEESNITFKEFNTVIDTLFSEWRGKFHKRIQYENDNTAKKENK